VSSGDDTRTAPALPTPPEVDAWLEAVLGPDPAIERAQRAADDAGLPPIQVSGPQGRLLQLLARSIGARRALEVGTLAGVSAIWIARGLSGPGARLTTLEVDPRHASVARENIAAAGLADVVEVLVGDARTTLAELVAAGVAPFDLVFIDADKPSNPAYLAAALTLTRPGSVIIVDNVVRRGAVADPPARDAAAAGSRAVIEAAAADPRLETTVIQTVGAKGHDGMLVARVRDSAASPTGGGS